MSIGEASPIGEILNKTMKQELIAHASEPARQMGSRVCVDLTTGARGFTMAKMIES
jgi:hypothetical protein